MLQLRTALHVPDQIQGLRAEEHAPGVLGVQLFSAAECEAIVAAAERDPTWLVATVADYHEVVGRTEVEDRRSRNALTKTKGEIPTLCCQFEDHVRSACFRLIAEKWRLANLDFEGTQLVKYSPGGFFKKHTDWGRSHPRRCVSVALYLNDNFSGGELHFPLLKLNHKPQMGECILFPSDYLHSGEPVSSGVKYVFLTFLLTPSAIV